MPVTVEELDPPERPILTYDQEATVEHRPHRFQCVTVLKWLLGTGSAALPHELDAANARCIDRAGLPAFVVAAPIRVLAGKKAVYASQNVGERAQAGSSL